VRRSVWALLLFATLPLAACADVAPEQPSPAVVAPGASVTEVVGSGVVSDTYVRQGTGPGAVSLPPAPRTATAIRVRFTCLAPGVYTWGPDPAQLQSVGCVHAEAVRTGWYDFSLWGNPQQTFTVTGPAAGEWAVSAVYVAETGSVFDADGDAYAGTGEDTSTGYSQRWEQGP
jgi:hypothetical protein